MSMRVVNVKLINWARRKYKRLRVSFKRAAEWLNGIYAKQTTLFAHWKLLNARPAAG
jgi:RNA-directed DNA polymerase